MPSLTALPAVYRHRAPSKGRRPRNPVTEPVSERRPLQWYPYGHEPRGRRCIETRIPGGNFDGQLRLIPRINLTSTEGELPCIVSRRQFSLRLCFAMIINKSQGQSFNYAYVDCGYPIYTRPA